MSALRKLLAALFVPLFAANLALLLAIGSTCASCKADPVRASACESSKPGCAPQH